MRNYIHSLRLRFYFGPQIKIFCVKSPLTTLTNERIFDGNQAAFTVSKYFLVDFICSFKMEKYPFDDQVCEANMTAPYEEKDLVKFDLKNLLYQGLEDINEYVFLKLTYTVGQMGESHEKKLQEPKLIYMQIPKI